nr:hypothetical protein [Tanacetum cinerariifolium]
YESSDSEFEAEEANNELDVEEVGVDPEVEEAGVEPEVEEAEARMREIIRDQFATSMNEFMANMNSKAGGSGGASGSGGAGRSGGTGGNADGTSVRGARPTVPELTGCTYATFIRAMTNVAPNNNETCQKCKNKRHAGDCWKCTKCGKLGHKTERCQTSEMSCYNCNEKGHRKRDCPKLGRNRQGGNNRRGAYQLGAVNAQEDPKVVTEQQISVILNFQQRFDESFHEAWDRYKDLLHAFPHHGFTEFYQLDTFYNALNPVGQDSLNSAAGGNLLERRTQDMLTIIENKSKCLVADGNTFTKLKDNIQGYVAAAAVNYNQGNSGYRPPGDQIQPPGSGSLPSKTIANPKGELKAITTRSGIVLDGPSVPIPPPFINPDDDERAEETLTDQDLAEDPLHPNIPYPSRMHKQKQQEKDEVQIHKFWQMFKQLHINITLVDALNLIPKYQKMLKSLLSNKEKLLELANTPLMKIAQRELKCKALADLGVSINLIPLSVLKKLGLPELISTRMTLELANRANCTPVGIARDVFVLVGKFTFLADFVIVDYESDPRVPFILGIPFLQIDRALIDVHGEEMILRDGDERLTLNMRHDTSSYSNQPQKESINMINVFNDSSEDFLEKLFTTNHQSGNPSFSSHPKLTSPEVKDDVFDPEGGNVLIEKLLDLDSTKDLHPPHYINPLSGSTTYSSPNHLLEEFVDKLALITFLPGNDDLQFDIESDLKEIEYLLHHDPIKDIDSILEDLINQSNLVDLYDNLADFMPEMFTDEHALDYSSPPLYDEYDDDLFEVESDTEYVYNDPFDSKGEKIKESKLLIDELDLPSDFLPSPEYDSFLLEDFSEVDALPSTNNEDKEPVEIMDREVKQLKQSRIPIVKVRWNSKRGPEYTWEREDQMWKNLVPAKSNSYYQAINDKSLYGEIVSPKKSQVKLKGQFKVIQVQGDLTTLKCHIKAQNQESQSMNN